MKFLITAIIAVILLVSVVSSCPSGCGCTDTSDGVHVNCSSRRLESIPPDLLNNTYDLQLQYNNISVIEDNTFNNLPRLYRLYLHHNKITSIKSGTLNKLTNLYQLYLHNNKITSIKPGMFHNLTNLNRLDLQFNDISVIEDNAFNNLPNLQYLYLHFNKITSIKSETFNNLANLKDVYLHGNDISVIENHTFNNLPNLRFLQLANNYISVIEDNTFNHLPNLQGLTLYGNGITSIKSDMFNNLPNLKKLDLSYNDIPVIEDNTFNHLPNLLHLYLHYNKITSIKSDIFNNLTNLLEIHLHNNKITSIKSDTFNNLTNLVKLLLRNNPIAFVSESAFLNLPKLRSLEFDMHCRGCGNIPFWRWLKRNEKFPISVTCNDYDGELLARLEPTNFIDCFISPCSTVVCNDGECYYNESGIAKCFNKVDPCYSNPCLNNGLCTNDGKGSALCSCHGDWTGSQCEVSPCSTVVCNDGECYYNESGIAKCFNKGDPCYSNPCLNNGICTNDGTGSALCSCHGDWTGSQCELSPCSTVVCNDGECYYNEYGIAKCFNKVDPCYSNPCLNNGLCTNDGKGSALCSCHGDWTGSQCEVSPCSTVVCNDGECYYNEYGIAKCFNQAATKSDDNYTVVYTGVGAFIATALVAVIIVLVTLRYRRTKKPQERRTTVANECLISGFDNIEPYYVLIIGEPHYDTIKTSTALRHA